MKGPIVGCERVSSFDQNLARRLQQIKLEDTDKIVDDKASGANTNWPTFQQMMKYVRWGNHRCAQHGSFSQKLGQHNKEF